MIYHTLIVVRGQEQVRALRGMPEGILVQSYDAPLMGHRFDRIVVAIDRYDPTFAWGRWYWENLVPKLVDPTKGRAIVGMEAPMLPERAG